MSLESINPKVIEFANIVGQDSELQEKLQACETPDEAYSFAIGILDGFTKEEFITSMQELNKYINDELNMEDLQNVAGGEGERETDGWHIAKSITYSMSVPTIATTIVFGVCGF